MDKIGEFLKEKGIEFRTSSNTVYSYYAPFGQSARLQGCNVQITGENEKIRISAELPIRVRRNECYIVSREIAELNRSLPEFGAYILDPISGSIQLAAQYDIPNDAETLEKMLNRIVQNIEGDVDILLNTIHDIEKEKSETSRDQEDEENWLNEDLESANHKGKASSLLKTVINFIGMVEPEEKD